MARRLMCRTHNGVFTPPARKGRPPVRCTAEYPCDRVDKPEISEEKAAAMVRAVNEAYPRLAERAAEASKSSNPSLPLAKAAKERLVAAGWVVQGKAGIDDTHAWASITASRDHETLNMLWSDGELAGQNYSMEFLNPTHNGVPDHDLHFDPNELTDSELVRMIKGSKVTWWNTIAGSKETAIIGGTVTVEHIFRDNGDEDNSKRIVKFIDHGGGGFRAFHVAALMKVG